MSFKRMAPDHPLVDMLIEQDWWKRIIEIQKSDPDFNVQIRADTINVYYKMGSFLKLSIANKTPIGEIHYKYIPVFKKAKTYTKVNFDGDNLFIPEDVEVLLVKNDLLSNENLKQIKQQMEHYVGEEKSIQSDLINHNKYSLIDAEIAFSNDGKEIDATEGSSDGNARIDLINVDKHKSSLVGVELKTISDKRLYNDDIITQMRKYFRFFTENETEILRAYQDTYKTKIRLGLIDSNFTSPPESVVLKPLLAIACGSQDIIDSFVDGHFKKLVPKIRDISSGVYLFGNEVDLNLVKSSQGNKYII